MNRHTVWIPMGLMAGLLTFGYTNCSDVAFEPGGELNEIYKANEAVMDEAYEAALEAELEEEALHLTEEEQQEVRAATPEEHLNNPVPISELESDPSLYETYKCRKDGVVICHVPDGTRPKCLPKPAISAHLDHSYTYNEGDEVIEVADYLGTCN